MNLRCDKVVRVIAPGRKRLYSIGIANDNAYLVQTGKVGALKHYRRDPGTQQIVVAAETQRDVRELQANEGRIDAVPLDDRQRRPASRVIHLKTLTQTTPAVSTPSFCVPQTSTFARRSSSRRGGSLAP